MMRLFSTLFVLQLILTASSSCLTNVTKVVSPEARKNVTIDGVSMPLGIIMFAWETSEIVSHVFKILIEEVLGYRTQLTRVVSSNHAVFILAGCPGAVACTPAPDAVSVGHVALEGWRRTQLSIYQDNYPDRAPITAGFMGYEGYDGTFFKQSIYDAGVQAGIFLDQSRSYNASMFEPAAFFTRISEINTSRLRPCEDVLIFMDTSFIGPYATYFSYDKDGFYNMSDGKGGFKYKARCHVDNVWWLSSACRQNSTRCVPWISDGYGFDYILQQAAYYNMPLAAASTRSNEDWLWINKNHDILTYWWVPDRGLLNLNLIPLSFPDFSISDAGAAEDYLVYYSGTTETWKISHFSLNTAAADVDGLLRSMKLSFVDVSTLLLRSGKPILSPEDAACNFLQTTNGWRAWIPSPKLCLTGFGLVKQSQQFVLNDVEAESCEWCPAGRASTFMRGTAVSQSRICDLCKPGKFSKQPLQTSCELCPEGFYTEKFGSTSCKAAEYGFYSDIKGAILPKRCNSSSPMTTLEEGTRSANGCICEVGFYKSESLCVSCASLHTTLSAGSTSENDCTLGRPTTIAIAVTVAVLAATACVAVVFGVFFRWRMQEYERQRDKNMDQILQKGLTSLKEFGYPMVLMSANQFLALTKEQLLLFHEGLRDEGMLLTIDTLQGVRAFKGLGNVIIFFSYQWQSFTKTGPNDSQLADMRRAVRVLIQSAGFDVSKAFIWLDAFSIPQCSEHLRRLAANTLYMYASLSNAMVIIAPKGVHEDTGEESGLQSYLQRVWTRIEQLAFFCANGTLNMFFMSEDGLQQIQDQWVQDIIAVFEGKLTCCRQKHPNGVACDREGMVPMLLGLYFEVTTSYLSESCLPHIEKVWNIIEARRDIIFPKDFIYEGARASERRELFGDLLTRAEKFVKSDPVHASAVIASAESFVKQPAVVALTAPGLVEVVVA